MEPDDVLEDATDTTSALQPLIALVQDGVLNGLYSADQAEAADRATMRLALASGRHVDVYEIAQSLPYPPALGTAVDPEHLGWVNVGVAR